MWGITDLLIVGHCIHLFYSSQYVSLSLPPSHLRSLLQSAQTEKGPMLCIAFNTSFVILWPIERMQSPRKQSRCICALGRQSLFYQLYEWVRPQQTQPNLFIAEDVHISFPICISLISHVVLILISFVFSPFYISSLDTWGNGCPCDGFCKTWVCWLGTFIRGEAIQRKIGMYKIWARFHL